MPDPNSADLMVRQHGIGAVERQERQPSFKRKRAHTYRHYRVTPGNDEQDETITASIGATAPFRAGANNVVSGHGSKTREGAVF